MQIAPISCPAPSTNQPAELAMLRRIEDEGPRLVRSYIQRETRGAVTYIARDKAKELFAEYNSNPTVNNRNADGAASAIADAARRTLLATPVSGVKNRVLIVTGCPASGKTVSIGPVSGDRIEIEHETILTSLARATELIHEALTARRLPIIRLFYTDDPRINARRMIARAIEQGRTVPLSYMARTYVTVPRIVAELEQNFGASLVISVVNNSEKPSQAIAHNSINRAIYHTSRYTVAEALEAMRAQVDEISGGPAAIPPEILREALS